MKSKNTYLKIVIILSAFIFLLMVNSCSDDVTPSLYSDQPKGATPVISSIDPPDKALAGITTVTITGENFSSIAEENFVFFNAAPAEILDVSSTQLVVKAPNIVGDDISIKIAVHKVELFSNTYDYVLEAALKEPFEFKDFQDPYAITTDENGNLYISLVEGNIGTGIKKIGDDGELVDFAPKGGETFYNGMKYGGGGILYGVRAVRAIFEITEGNSPVVFVALDNGTAMYDLDFDQDLNIWTGGNGGKIFRVTPDKDIKSFEFEPSLRSIRVFNDQLYVAGFDDSGSKVWKFQIISSDSLGPATDVFNVEANYPSASAEAITFSEDGILFIGTDSEVPVIAVYPDGSFGEWYSGVLSSPVTKFAWGTGTNLYFTRGKSAENGQTVFELNMERNGAPHYGRD